jgi:HK97 family phage major capsid protein
MDELKALVEESQKLLKIVREKDAEAAEERKARGEESAETKAAIAKMDERFVEIDKRLDEIKVEQERRQRSGRGSDATEIETRMAAIASNAAKKEIGVDEVRAHRKAILNWMRHGKAAMDAEERKNLVEDATGELLVMFDLDPTLYRVMPQLNVIRNLAGSRTTGKDRIRARAITELTAGWGKLETGTSIVASSGTPSEAYMYVEDLYGLTKIGEDELMDGDFDLEAYAASSFAIAIANAEEAGFASGTGHGSQEPVGLNTATITGFDGTNTVDTPSTHTDGTIDLNEFLTVEYSLKAQYAARASWLVHRQTVAGMRKLKDTNGRYLWVQGGVTGGSTERVPDTFNGYAVNQSVAFDQFPTATGSKYPVCFGDFANGYLVLDRLGMTVQRLNELYAETGLVGFKVHRRVGGGVIRGEAIARLKSTHA